MNDKIFFLYAGPPFLWLLINNRCTLFFSVRYNKHNALTLQMSLHCNVMTRHFCQVRPKRWIISNEKSIQKISVK